MLDFSLSFSSKTTLGEIKTALLQLRNADVNSIMGASDELDQRGSESSVKKALWSKKKKGRSPALFFNAGKKRKEKVL